MFVCVNGWMVCKLKSLPATLDQGAALSKNNINTNCFGPKRGISQICSPVRNGCAVKPMCPNHSISGSKKEDMGEEKQVS